MSRRAILQDLNDDWYERPVTSREAEAASMRSEQGLVRLRREQERRGKDPIASLLSYHLEHARPRAIPLPPLPVIPRGIEYLKGFAKP